MAKSSTRVARRRITIRRNRTLFVNPVSTAVYGSLLEVGVPERLSAKQMVDLPAAHNATAQVCSGNSYRVRDRPNDAAEVVQRRRLVVIRACHDDSFTQLVVMLRSVIRTDVGPRFVGEKGIRESRGCH